MNKLRSTVSKVRLDIIKFIRATLHTIFNEWVRFSILMAISILFLSLYIFISNRNNGKIKRDIFWDKKVVGYFEETNHAGDHYFHLFLEFLGVAITFLIVDHVVKKTESGLEDPKPFPIDRFIYNITKARHEIIIFDTFLETLLLDSDEMIYSRFRQALSKFIYRNKECSIKVLILDAESKKPISDRAEQRKDIDSPEEYRSRMIRAKEKLLHIKKEIISKAIETNKLSDKKSFIIKEYNSEVLPFSFYSTDENAYVGFYIPGFKSTDTRQIFTPNDTEHGKNVYIHFHSIFKNYWDGAVEIL